MRICSSPSGHKYAYLGVKYWKTDRRLPGSSSVEIRYYDAFFCEICLDMQLKPLSMTSHSFVPVLFNATSVPADKIEELRRS